MVTVIASQLLSSPLRDHYAVLLLLPVAWLGLSRFDLDGDHSNSGLAVRLRSVPALLMPATATDPDHILCGARLVLFEAYRERREVRRGPGGCAGDLASDPAGRLLALFPAVARG